MRSTKYSLYCQKTFGRFFSEKTKEKLDKKDILFEMANITMNYGEYYAMAIMNIFLGILITLISTIIIYLIIPNMITFAIIFFVTPLISVIIAGYYLYLPDYLVKKRALNIDKFLPYAINFISSMATAGVSPAEIFETLSTIDVYGEIQTEAKRIAKEIKIMGIDNISALKQAIKISPSRKFKTFLQGMIGTIQSGSDLSEYLSNIVDNYLEEDIVERKKTLELLSVVAESFVISVIAFPIFLVIILSIMGFFGGSMDASIVVLYLFSFLVLPIVYIGFYVLITSTTIEEISRIRKEKFFIFKDFYQEYKKAIQILILSFIAFGVFCLILYLLINSNYFEYNFYLMIDILLIGFLFIIGPVSFYLHTKTKEKREIQNRLPDFLVEVGDSLNSGMTPFEAIKVAEKGKYGKLDSEIKKMKSQLSWNISVRQVFNNFSYRMKSGIIKRIIVTINEGLLMGGNTSKIFKAAATEVNQVNQIDNQRRANMAVYMSVILLCFFVFLAIILIIDKTIFSTFFDLQNAQAEKVSSFGNFKINIVEPMKLKYALFSFVFVQSIGAGVLSGYMLDAKISSGVRYGVVLAIVSFIVFKLLF